MDSPFKFLEAYGPTDFDEFFGREKETAQLYNAVYASNLTLLYGASGTGKTSLVNCGLRNKFYYTEWLPVFVKRSDNINESLANALSVKLKALEEVDDNPPEINNLVDLLDYLYLAYYKPVYLIFDQFEELYISGSAAEQFEFYQSIKAILDAGLQVKIILIIREEWIAFLNNFEKVIPTLFDNRLRIERMTNRTIARVILNTLNYHKIQLLEPKETIYAIIENLKDKEGIALTNLQVYLDKLFQKQLQNQKDSSAEKVVFSLSLVQEVGPMKNVLADFLEEQLLLLEEKLKKTRGIKNPKGIPTEILFALVTDDHTKRSLNFKEIKEQLPRSLTISEADISFCLDEFQRIRVLMRE